MILAAGAGAASYLHYRLVCSIQGSLLGIIQCHITAPVALGLVGLCLLNTRVLVARR